MANETDLDFSDQISLLESKYQQVNPYVALVLFSICHYGLLECRS